MIATPSSRKSGRFTAPVILSAALGWRAMLSAAAAEGIARQPSAADKITGAVNLPLFLLEGVAIIAEVGVLLIVLLK